MYALLWCCTDLPRPLCTYMFLYPWSSFFCVFVNPHENYLPIAAKENLTSFIRYIIDLKMMMHCGKERAQNLALNFPTMHLLCSLSPSHYSAFWISIKYLIESNSAFNIVHWVNQWHCRDSVIWNFWRVALIGHSDDYVLWLANQKYCMKDWKAVELSGYRFICRQFFK